MAAALLGHHSSITEQGRSRRFNFQQPVGHSRRVRLSSVLLPPRTSANDRTPHASHVRHLYEGKQECPFSSTDAITVPRPELEALTCELEPLLGTYRSPISGLVGNGLYALTGSSASPRRPSSKAYAKIRPADAAQKRSAAQDPPSTADAHGSSASPVPDGALPGRSAGRAQ